MDVFDVFELTPYTFLTISRGGVAGNVITDTTDAEGVFKLRTGMVSGNDQETKSADATLKIRPDETFVSTGFIGHGIRIQGKDYEITGLTAGDNYDDGTREHYQVTLQAADFSKWTVA